MMDPRKELILFLRPLRFPDNTNVDNLERYVVGCEESEVALGIDKPDVEESLVGQLQEEQSRTYRKHLHAYLKFRDGFGWNRVRQLFVDSPWKHGLDVTATKNPKKAVEYVTKEDKFPLYNMTTKDFHENFKLRRWALKKISRGEAFDVLDPFVSGSKKSDAFLEKYYVTMKKQLIINQLPPLSPVREVPDVNWARESASWYNEVITNYHRRMPQLYLYGAPRIGKTMFVEDTLIGNVYKDTIYYQEKGQWFLSELDADFHMVIIFEETRITDLDSGIMKRLLEGAPVSISRKGRVASTICWRKPIIIISNHGLPPNLDAALRDRLLVVHADEAVDGNTSVVPLHPEIGSMSTWSDLNLSGQSTRPVPSTSQHSSRRISQPSISSASSHWTNVNFSPLISDPQPSMSRQVDEHLLPTSPSSFETRTSGSSPAKLRYIRDTPISTIPKSVSSSSPSSSSGSSLFAPDLRKVKRIPFDSQ